MVMKSKITKEYLEQKYCKEFLSHGQIAKELGVWPHTIQRACKRFGIKGVRRYLWYKEDFFESWNADMAYILAFLTCDAYIATEKNRYNWLGLELCDKDVCVLEFIKSKICPDAKIRYRKRVFVKTNSKTSLAILRLNSRRIIDSLAKLGITRQKTGKEIIIDVPEPYRADYVRGLIDGDGCISLRNIGKYKGCILQFTSASKKFLNDLNIKYLNNFGTIRKQFPHNCYVLSIQNRPSIIKILSWVYNGNFCLNRKYEKYLDILKYEKEMNH